MERGMPAPIKHIIHARQHRAENRGQRGELDFFQKIDAHQPVMAFLGQKDLRKIGRARSAPQSPRPGFKLGQWRELERALRRLCRRGRSSRATARSAMPGTGKLFQRPADMPARIATLQPPR